MTQRFHGASRPRRRGGNEVLVRPKDDGAGIDAVAKNSRPIPALIQPRTDGWKSVRTDRGWRIANERNQIPNEKFSAHDRHGELVLAEPSLSNKTLVEFSRGKVFRFSIEEVARFGKRPVIPSGAEQIDARKTSKVREHENDRINRQAHAVKSVRGEKSIDVGIEQEAQSALRAMRRVIVAEARRRWRGARDGIFPPREMIHRGCVNPRNRAVRHPRRARWIGQKIERGIVGEQTVRSCAQGWITRDIPGKSDKAGILQDSMRREIEPSKIDHARISCARAVMRQAPSHDDHLAGEIGERRNFARSFPR